MRTPTTRPVLSVVFIVMMPLPPRCVRRYSSIADALAVAVLGDGEQRAAGLDEVDRHQLVALVEATCRGRRRCPDPSAGPRSRRSGSAWPSRVERMTSRLPVGEAHPDDLVALLERDGDDARRARRRVLHQVGLLDQAAAGREDDVAALAGIRAPRGRRRASPPASGCSRLVIALPACRAPGLRDLVDLQPVDLPGRA